MEKVDQSLHGKRVYTRDEHNIARADLDQDAVKIISRLQQAGYKAYVVGGGVRDLLIGKTPKDFDIATDATPNRIKALFRNCRIIGKRFKLAHIYFHHNKIIEVATFRDVSDPVDPEAEEGVPMPNRDNNYGSEETDALRRDITINGLFFDPSNFSILDYVGGMTDLRKGIVRVIGDPAERFKEDPVRMLRVVRHAARSGFSIEQGCWDAIGENRGEILRCSQVRVFEELKKDLVSGYWLEISSLLAETGLIELLLPELCEKDFALLSPGSQCSHGFERLDRMARDGEKPNPTTVFALMALFRGAEYIPSLELADGFEDENAVREHTRDCFLGLSVPRKDREKLESLLSLWFKISITPPDKLKRSMIARNPMLPELHHLARILFDENDAESPFANLPPVEHDEEDSEPRRDRPFGKRNGRPRGQERPRTTAS